jgi:prepilin-type N-terminal cleavage/methylation domain-containing protein
MMNQQAHRHEGIKASSGSKPHLTASGGPRGTRGSTLASSHHTFRGRGFSLIEVLLAIFILGIGAISIAAIFPAGIVQQRQTVDDMMGPIVANNALELLRSKLKPDDFGTFEQHGMAPPIVTIPGDWPWSRPAFVTASPLVPTPTAGTIGIFGTAGGTATEIPHNLVKWPGGAPEITFRQGERYYPQASTLATVDVPPKPEYVWDCMFRRFEGRVYVAVFVYRVALPNVGSYTYQVQANPSAPGLPPLPIWEDFPVPERQWDAFGPDLKPGTADDAQVPATAAGSPFDPTDIGHQWQFPGQWILDQNNNVHRVQFGREREEDGPVVLARPVPALPTLLPTTGSVYSYAPPTMSGHDGADNVVTNIWYMPRSVGMTLPGGITTDITITPVYLMVREL